MSAMKMDGLVAGLAVLPDAVQRAEWLPQEFKSGTVFDNIEEAEEKEAVLVERYNDVGRTLEEDPKRYQPLLERDERTGGVVWKPWIVGFASAMQLRPGVWARFESTDNLDVQESVQATQKLYEAANGTSKLGQVGLDLLDDVAPMLIGTLIRDLNAARKSGFGDAGDRSLQDTMH